MPDWKTIWFYRLLGVGLFLLAWEVFARNSDSILLAPFSETIVELGRMIQSGHLLKALIVSNKAMILGFLISGIIGVPLGIAMARMTRFEHFIDVYMNILLITPMAAIIPLLIIYFGLTLLSRVIIVIVFTIVVIVANTRAGIRQVDPLLIDMAKTFGANELDIWRRVLLPSAMPAIMAGLRLGMGRALTAMVVSELLLVAVGLGEMLLDYMGLFKPGKLYAVILTVCIEATVLMHLVKMVEKKLTDWQN